MDAIIHDWKFYFPVEEKTGILLNEEKNQLEQWKRERKMTNVPKYFHIIYKINIRKIKKKLWLKIIFWNKNRIWIFKGLACVRKKKKIQNEKIKPCLGTLLNIKHKGKTNKKNQRNTI